MLGAREFFGSRPVRRVLGDLNPSGLAVASPSVPSSPLVHHRLLQLRDSQPSPTAVSS